MTIENPDQIAPAGLSASDWAMLGSGVATERVVTKHPELGQKPPAGLSTIEWAQAGLESAVEKVRGTGE